MVWNPINNTDICWGLWNIYQSISNTKGDNVYKPLRKTCRYFTGFPKMQFIAVLLFSSIAAFELFDLKCYPVTEHKTLCKMFSETRSASLRQPESENFFQVLSSIRPKRSATFESSLRICAGPSNMK